MRTAALALAIAACSGKPAADHASSPAQVAADAAQLLGAVGAKPRAYARLSASQPKVRAVLAELEPIVRPIFGESLSDCGIELDKLASIRVAVGEPLRIAGEIDGAISVASVTCVIGRDKLAALTALGLVLRDRPGGIAVQYKVDPTQADAGRVAATELAARCHRDSCAVERLGTTAKPIDVEIELGDAYEIKVGGAGFAGAAAAVVAAIKAQSATTPALGNARFRNDAGTLVASFPDGTEQATALVALRQTLLEAFRMPSTSMVPTLVQGDHVFAAKGALAGAIAPGDVVVYRREDREYAKRVLGVAGQTITESDAGIAIDGVPLPTEEMAKAFTYTDTLEDGPVEHVTGVELREHLGARSYTTVITGGPRGGGPWTVGADQLFVVGDNRHNSLDSRITGPVSRADVLGRVVAIWWSWHDGAPDWDRIGTRVE